MTDHLAARAEQYYDPALPYHNWDHAVRATRYGVELAHRCHAENVTANLHMIRYALWFHDAGYRTDEQAVGCATKEQYAAAIAAHEMTLAGHDLPSIAGVVGCILATHRLAVPVTVEQKIVRAADLAELAADYTRFRINSEALRTEAGLLSGKEVSPVAWRTGSISVIVAYLAQDIHLTGQHDAPDGVSDFHRKAVVNLGRYLADETT